MDYAVKPQPVRPPASLRPDPASASESSAGFASAVDSSLAGTAGASTQNDAPSTGASGKTPLSSPLFGPDILVAGPSDGAPVPAEPTPGASGLEPPSPQIVKAEPLLPPGTGEAPPVPVQNAVQKGVNQPTDQLVSKGDPKTGKNTGEGEADPSLPAGVCMVVLSRPFDRSGPVRNAQPSERKADTGKAEKDPDPALGGEPVAAVASPAVPLPAVPVPGVNGAAPGTRGSVDPDPATGKGAVTGISGHPAHDIDPTTGQATRASPDGDAAGFALPTAASAKGETSVGASALTGQESVRAPTHAPDAKAPPAAQPVIAAQPGRLGHDLGVEVVRRISAGGDQLVVHLSPAELGRIEVRMSFDDRGGLSTVFAADKPAALDMLRRDSADLSRALNDAGFRSETHVLRFDSGERGSGGQPRTPWQTATPRQGNGADVEPEIFDQTAFRTLQTRGRYNLMA